MTMLANVDALTGVYNRRKISELLDYWIASSNESMHIFSVIMLDIDKMKRINDDYGHDTGDYVLRHLAEVLKMNLRETDLLGRWGGDEFLIICPKSNFEHTVQLSRRLENAVQAANFITVGNMTVSTGVATYEHNDTSDSLFKRADTSLYLAKEAKNPPA
jgi:diguanylate cyclase (GGDEF)-like protein